MLLRLSRAHAIALASYARATVADEPEAGIRLVEHCVRFAEQFGVDHMLDVIAGVHQAYARMSNDSSIRIAYEIAGIDLEDNGALPLQ